MAKTARYFLITAALICMAACTSRDEQVKNATPSTAQVPGGRVQQKASVEEKDIMLKIVPENPTTQDSLQVLWSGEPGTARYRWQRNGMDIEGQDRQALLKGLCQKGDQVTAVVTVAGREVTASTVIANSPPRILTLAVSPQQIHCGVDIAVAPKGEDMDEDIVRYRYRWHVNEQQVGENSPILSGSAFRKGDKISLTVLPFDPEGEGTEFVMQPFIIPSAPPSFVSTPPGETVSQSYTYKAAAKDPDGDPLVYSLASAPPGMSIDKNTGDITWKYGPGQGGTYQVEIVAQDPEGVKAFQRYTLNVGETR